MVLRVQQPGKRREDCRHLRGANDREQTFLARAKHCSVRGRRKWKRGEMSDEEHATHRHKRLGEVVLLRSTAELAQVLLLSSGEKLWVKVTDLSKLANDDKQSRPHKKPRGTRRDSGQ
jgi:hypothetical protein